MSAGLDESGKPGVVLPVLEADPLFADAVDEAIAGDVAAMPGVRERPVGRDPHDFSSLYIRHRSSFVAHARRYLSDQRDIDEVVQEALLRLFLALPELETELQALAYCRRTVTNLCIDRFRAQKRAPRMVGYDEAADADLWDDGNVDDPIFAAEDAAIVREALALLSPTHRDALIKREIEEKSFAQIAEEMGIPETAVKHTLHRARRSLRRVLATLWTESGQAVKSALVVILAVLISLPFLARSGGGARNADNTAALGAQPTPSPSGAGVALGGHTPAPVAAPTVTTAPGIVQWPTVPDLRLPDVPVPTTAPTTSAPQPKPPVDSPTTTPTPTPTDGGDPSGKPQLTVSGYTLASAPTMRQQLFLQPRLGDTQVSALSAQTTQGDLVLNQSFTKFTNGSMDMTVVPQLPLAGKSVAADLKRLDVFNAQVNTDNTVTVTYSAAVAIPPCDIPGIVPAGTVSEAQVDIDLRLSSDLASVLAEHVRVTPNVPSQSSSADVPVSCGGPPAPPRPPADGTTSPDPTAPTPEPAVGVKEQVTVTP
jgi:RNA polymerase sigma factor (sigma-70 family)